MCSWRMISYACIAAGSSQEIHSKSNPSSSSQLSRLRATITILNLSHLLAPFRPMPPNRSREPILKPNSTAPLRKNTNRLETAWCPLRKRYWVLLIIGIPWSPRNRMNSAFGSVLLHPTSMFQKLWYMENIWSILSGLSLSSNESWLAGFSSQHYELGRWEERWFLSDNRVEGGCLGTGVLLYITM
jgi:hypothetical protein